MNCHCYRPDRNCEKCHAETRGFTWTMPPWVDDRLSGGSWLADEILGETISSTAGDSNHHWVTVCQYCGQSHHPEACPRVKSIEYYSDGRVKKVELHPPDELYGSLVFEPNVTSTTTTNVVSVSDSPPLIIEEVA